MAKDRVTTHRDSDGVTHETQTTIYDDGSQKIMTRDMSDGNIVFGYKIESVTYVDRDGNSTTERARD
jgi:hypothetical protein